MSIQAPLLAWYRRNRRDLPWRQTSDPYAIWVSEVMLQQTQVATVIGYYERWMRRFPTLAALAAADEDAVLHAWKGLGYYSRARSLQAGARMVLERHRGELPRDVTALRALPGIGPYTAGAIASIAFGAVEPVVDGNVKRVLTRLFALRGDPARAPLARELWEVARELVPTRAPGDFNQALMELGATVCTPKRPSCERCPLSARCLAHRDGIASELPETAPRAPAEQVQAALGLVSQRGRVLVTRIPESARRWAGMWQFPTTEIERGETAAAAAERAVREATGLAVARMEPFAVVRHSVTRFRIRLDAYRCFDPSGTARAIGCSAVAWRRPSELSELALPAAHEKIAARLRASGHG